MRALRLLSLTLLLAPLAGCLDDAGTQDIGSEADWVIAQADALSGDVAGFVFELPQLMPCDINTDVNSINTDVSADAGASGASASAGDASGSASLDGATVSAPCANASVSTDGASVSAAGQSASAGLDGVSFEIVPDTSALGKVTDFAFYVYAVKDGVATHVKTVLSTEVTKVESLADDPTGGVMTTVMEAQSMVPFEVPLAGLGLEPGDQIAFVMAAAGDAQAMADGAVAGAHSDAEAHVADAKATGMGIVHKADALAQSRIGALGLPVDVPDYGFAFRMVDSASADPAAALAEIQGLAAQGRAQLDGAVATAEGAAAGAQGDADAAVADARSTLDAVLATGEAHAMEIVGQANGFDIGFFGDFAKGALNDAAGQVQFLTDSMPVDISSETNMVQDMAFGWLAKVETVSISYDAGHLGVNGWGVGLGAYAGEENGNVDYDLSATVHDQSFAQAGSITAAGGQSVGDVDPAYLLEGAGGDAQALVFDVQRHTSDAQSSLWSLHSDLSANLGDLLGVTDTVPVDASSLKGAAEGLMGGIPVGLDGSALQFETGIVGPITLLGVF